MPSKPAAVKNSVVPSRPVSNTGSISAAKQSRKLPIAPGANIIKLPSNDITSQVIAIVSDEAHLDPSELKPQTEFADFGIESLLSLTILSRLRDEVGLDLPSTLFADYPTVEKLQNFIGVDRSPSLSSGSSSQGDTDVLTAELVSEPDTDRLADIIRTTISEETGVPIEELIVSAKLSELGIDSLLVLTAIGKLSEALDIEVPQSLFVENATLYDLERALDMTIKRTHVKICPNAAKLQTIQEVNNIDTAPYATSVLLQGNSKTATRKLFLFPDGSGSATSYSSLTRISPDVAVYGLNCPWMKTPQNMTVPLEQQIAKYLLEVRRRQPHGPYYLGGWSAGGICAYEAAQQLSLASESTARLVLIDSPNPVGLENPPQRMYDFFDSLGIFGDGGKPPPSWLRPHFDAFIRLLDEYKVKAFKGNLETHIVYARDGICKLPSDPRPEIRPDDPREMLWLLNNRTDFSGSGWCELVGKENMRITVLDNVNHFTMVEAGPEIGKLGAFIKKAME